MNLFEKKYYEETERFKVKEKAKIISELYSLKERIELLLKGEINDELLKRTLDEIDKITLNKLFEDYWKNEDPGYFNIDNSETIENFLSNYWKEKYYKN